MADARDLQYKKVTEITVKTDSDTITTGTDSVLMIVGGKPVSMTITDFKTVAGIS